MRDVVFLQGDEGQDCWQLQCGGIRILISQAHPHPEELSARVRGLLELAHPALLPDLQWLALPFATLKGEPGPLGTVPASAHPAHGQLFIWGKQHAERDYVAFNLMIFEHELAHLSGSKTGPVAGGPPGHLVEAWQEAMRADAQHHASLNNPPSAFTELVRLEGALHRQFLLGGELLNHQVLQQEESERLIEDWAESAECYFRQLREGALWAEGEQRLDFTEWWPHRNELLTEWVASRC